MLSILIDPTFNPAPIGLAARELIANSHRQLQHPLDLEIVETLRKSTEALGTWRVINQVARSLPARTRMEGRANRKAVLSRVTPLVRAGFLRRVGRSSLALP